MTVCYPSHLSKVPISLDSASSRLMLPALREHLQKRHPNLKYN
ncbi:hypothetical protein M595_2687 [Lyngbya aestuarii BL J]|uniref:Uncharacterized protein n=1 Tax=Lyngbya aestuarii BL J TaxID=1348334 RepID=U7QJ57_9CYAN|nr:hypothetical protein M595_2687 [Lyngbya aestuarii BL J]